jgi:AraC-like DNA-binding protein
MTKPLYLVLRGRIFRFRKGLSPTLSAIIGRSEISRSLHTSELAVARDRRAIAWADWVRLVEIIRTNRGLTGEEVASLVRDFVETEFDKFGALKRAVDIAPALQSALDAEMRFHARSTKQLASSIAEDDYRRMQAYLDEFLEARGYHLDRSSAAYQEIIRRLAPAWLAGVSRMYFAAQFREATGLRPHEYVLRRRIGVAKQMLEGSEQPLVEIALGVGFQTQSHFTTVFKRMEGFTPHRWRQLNRGSAEAASIAPGNRTSR